MSGSTLTAALFGISTSASYSDPILNALYGSSAAATTPSAALLALKNAEANETKEVAVTEQQPAVARDIAAFKAAVASATSPATLLTNPTVLKVLLTAEGLGDQAQYTALAQKALLSDASDPSSVASQLSDTRWKTVAAKYDFAGTGLATLSGEVDDVADAYVEMTWRASLDAATPGLSSALTFREEASGITSVDQILGDLTMRDVVTTTLGIPAEIANQDLVAQEKAISDRLDVSKFQDPAYVDGFVQQYLIAKASSASSTSGSVTSLSALAVQAAGLVV